MKVESNYLKTIYVIGDSHALAFRNKSITISDLGLMYSTTVSYLRGFQPSYISKNGTLNPAIAQFIFEQGLISDDGSPAALTNDQLVLSEQYATGECFKTELVVFIAGEIYVRKYLSTLNNDDDLDVAKIEANFRTEIASYTGTISNMREAFGFTVVIHEITPPTADDIVFEKANGHSCPRERRGFVYRLFNELLQKYANEANIGFCRSSDYLADETGCLTADYEFDGVHANPKYASTSMTRVVENFLHNRMGDGTLRYNSWCRLLGIDKSPPKISKIGISEAVAAFDEEQVRLLKDDIRELDYLTCTQPRHDWAHTPPGKDSPTFNHVIKYGRIGLSGLELLYKVLITGPLGDKIRSLIGSRFSIVNVRPVESLPYDGDGEGIGQQTFHRDGCPPAVFRGLLYLVDVGVNDGGFEYHSVEGAGEPMQVMGKAGSWILFDANAIDHRASTPKVKTRLALDFILLAIPEGTEEIVHCADKGLYWPIDPYQFSLTELVYPPSQTRESFYPALIWPAIKSD